MRPRLVLALGLVVLAGTALGQSLGLDPLSDRFAICAGRFSALMERQWLRDDPASTASETRFETMRELLRAVVAPDKANAALARETEAKFAFDRLLTRAEREGAWAKTRADAEIAECAALLLD